MVRGWGQRWGDAVMAFGFLSLAIGQTVGDATLQAPAKVGSCAVALAVGVALWQRRAVPLVLLAVTLASLVLRPLVPEGGDGEAYGIPALIGAYTCATVLEGRRLRVGAFLITVMAAYLAATDGGDFGSWVFYALLFGAPWVGGRVIRLSRQRQSLLEEQAVLLEAQRDEQARAAVADERQRIARELHDVVAHAISVVVLQSRGGRRVAATDPTRAEEAFSAIERTSTEALGEMRRLLGLLRADENQTMLPQPTLARLDALAEDLRSSGLPVEVVVEGHRGDLPPGVDVSAYRIVQEALTNALKHAGPARARVRVAHEPGAVTVEVVDDGEGEQAPPAPGSGHGLVGIKERVAIVGGEVEAGPRPSGGYAVSARLPYAAER